MARIVLNTFGSFGDIHPYLAVAIGLNERGHRSVLATCEVYRKKVEGEGVEFAPVRPDVGELLNDPDLLAKIWDPKKGSVYLMRDYLLPRAAQGYDDLSTACRGADLLVTHAASYAGPVVADALKLRWISLVLQPAMFFSTYDPPVFGQAEWAKHIYGWGRWVFASMRAVARTQANRWARPVYELRTRLGLAPGANPVIEGTFSPYGTLALFSGHFAKEQPDWPSRTETTGFVFYDRRGEGFGDQPEDADGLSEGLRTFLRNGAPPVLFTLGSSAVLHPGTFYRESLAAANELGVRAVLLIGRMQRNEFPSSLPNSTYLQDYAPYSALMPWASVVVHQGGIGTVAQSLRAGRPMLVVPWAHDQPDNAERLRKLGVARSVKRSNYTCQAAVRELKEILGNPGYQERASELARLMGKEDGLAKVCDALERALGDQS